MKSVVRKLLFLLALCWLPCFLVLCFIFLALSTRGEPIDLAQASTWFVFGMSAALAGLFALFPALAFASLLAAALFKRDAARSGAWPGVLNHVEPPAGSSTGAEPQISDDPLEPPCPSKPR